MQDAGEAEDSEDEAQDEVLEHADEAQDEVLDDADEAEDEVLDDADDEVQDVGVAQEQQQPNEIFDLTVLDSDDDDDVIIIDSNEGVDDMEKQDKEDDDENAKVIAVMCVCATCYENLSDYFLYAAAPRGTGFLWCTIVCCTLGIRRWPLGYGAEWSTLAAAEHLRRPAGGSVGFESPPV